MINESGGGRHSAGRGGDDLLEAKFILYLGHAKLISCSMDT